MSFNTVTSSGAEDKVSTAIRYKVHIDGANTKVLPDGTPPSVVYRVGDGTVHPEGWDNVIGETYLDFYVSSGSQGIQGIQGNDGLDAYDQAVQAGFQGTPSEWYTLISSVTSNANVAQEDAEAAAASALAAANSATSAAGSAVSAASSETNAGTSASNASISETNAGTSATNAAGSASNAANSAASASSSASAASTSAINAAQSATDAAASYASLAGEVAQAAASATASQLSEWEAEAERLTAASYALEAEDVPVNHYTSDGDGTFTATPQAGVFSSLHYEAKASAVVGGIDGQADVDTAGKSDTDMLTWNATSGNWEDIPRSVLFTSANTSADTASFNGLLSGTDTNVQSALNTLDDTTAGSIPVSAAGFTGTLSPTDTDVQTALATLDEITLTSSFADLTDTDMTTSAPSVNDFVRFDGANWVPITLSSLYATTPVLTGDATVNESTTVVVTDTAYDASNTYTSSVDFGSRVDNGDGTYTITAPTYGVATGNNITFSIYASKAGLGDSPTVTKVIAVTEVSIVADTALTDNLTTDVINDGF